MEEEILTWSTVPVRSSRRAAIFGAAFLVLLVGWFGFGRPLFGILGFGMLLGSTAEYWLGTSFRLDKKGATARTGPCVTAMEWGEVRRVLMKENEVRLSPLEAASTLDAFRGVGLVVTSDNRESVMAFVNAHVEGVADGTP